MRLPRTSQGDRPFDHRPMLPVDLLELVGLGLPAGVAEQVLVLVEGQRSTELCWLCTVPAAGSPRHSAPKVTVRLGVPGRVNPFGQVTVPAWKSTVKSSRVNPPGTAGRIGIGLMTGVCPASASSARVAPDPYAESPSTSSFSVSPWPEGSGRPRRRRYPARRPWSSRTPSRSRCRARPRCAPTRTHSQV